MKCPDCGKEMAPVVNTGLDRGVAFLCLNPDCLVPERDGAVAPLRASLNTDDSKPAICRSLEDTGRLSFDDAGNLWVDTSDAIGSEHFGPDL